MTTSNMARQAALTAADKFWYILGCIAMGSGYFVKIPVKKALSDLGLGGRDHHRAEHGIPGGTRSVPLCGPLGRAGKRNTSNRRKIRKSTAIASVTLLAGATAFGIAGCKSTSTTAAPPPATSTTAPAAVATPASDTQVCNDVNTWEQNNDGLAASSFGTDAESEAIVQEASGSSTVDTDVQNLSGDSGSSAAADISSLAADCAATGVTLTGSDFSQAAPAPSTPAPAPSTPAPAPSPAFTPATLLNASGSGAYTTQRFTVGGSGDYDVKWSYSEGSFGQSVNFALYADGGSDFNFTDPNQLGTGGSGTVHVYGDAGTHSITVNSEGDWTISVVTTP